MKIYSIYRYNVVSGNVYTLSARHCGPQSSSIKKSVLNWHDQLLCVTNQALLGHVLHHCKKGIRWKQRLREKLQPASSVRQQKCFSTIPQLQKHVVHMIQLKHVRLFTSSVAVVISLYGSYLSYSNKGHRDTPTSALDRTENPNDPWPV